MGQDSLEADRHYVAPNFTPSFLPLPKNLWVDSGQIEESVLDLQFFASFRAFEIWKSDF